MTPDQRYSDLSDILLTVILLLVRLSEMSDTRLSVTPDQRYMDISDILLTVILLLVRLSENDIRLFVTPDNTTWTFLTFC